MTGMTNGELIAWARCVVAGFDGDEEMQPIGRGIKLLCERLEASEAESDRLHEEYNEVRALNLTMTLPLVVAEIRAQERSAILKECERCYRSMPPGDFGIVNVKAIIEDRGAAK